MAANTGFNAPCEPPRWKVEDFLTGFTPRKFLCKMSAKTQNCLFGPSEISFSFHGVNLFGFSGPGEITSLKVLLSLLWKISINVLSMKKS